MRLQLLVPLSLLAFALPATAASAASCTGTVASVTQGNANLQTQVSCDTAINTGSITVTLNRGGNIVGSPTYTGTPGNMACAEGQPNPSTGKATIACQGSLPAGTTITILSSSGPGPCSSPAFAADLTVAFGDGTTFGPQALTLTGCGGGGGGGDGGGGPSDPGPGHDFDPGGVFPGSPQGLPRRATVAQARHGLSFTIKLGVRGKVIVTIEVGKKVVGRSPTHRTHAGPTHLVAKLSAAGAKSLAGKHTRAKVHIEVIPNADEGFTTHGRKYYSLTLTG